MLQSVSVKPGDLIADARGNLTNLSEGVIYRPSGCTQQACSQAYTGSDPVQMDQLVVRFMLLPGLQWSDGTSLTAADSVYSYEVARSLSPAALPEQINDTITYRAIDDLTVEWTGVPGFMDGQYQTKFFSPLPQHLWASIPVNELSSNAVSSQKPLGWGPYVIDEWVPGDHITLHANPLYFRASEGLPHFDNLVYRFVADNSEALMAVLAGECDLVGQAAGLESETAALMQLRDKGSISLTFQMATAWDLLEFDISPLSTDRPAFFASKEVRQAVALCIDRQALVDSLSDGQMQVADLYVPADHPLYNPAARHYAFDPQAGSDQLTAAGWLDKDGDPATPRIARGVSGVADGTSFIIQYLTAADAQHQTAAKMIQANLAKCGIQANIAPQPVQQYLAAGPDGPVFGRAFDLAQLAWTASLEPACNLYLTSEIPGPYPEYPKGWGGENASGYTNPEYDQACANALFSLPDSAQHSPEHYQAQKIYSEELPGLPLYVHYNVSVARPDLCNYTSESAMDSPLWNLETLDYGCSQ
jgi:peptide/nickel transport system substrate-binding protein